MNANREKNQAAFRRAQQELLMRFPRGHFVADGASFDELTAALAAVDKDQPDIFVVQVGVEYPDEIFILL